MMSLFIDNAIGGWIRNAEKTGELKNNAYNGKELDLEDYFKTPAEHRMGMKILKDANCLPPAVELMKQIEKKKAQLSNESDLQAQEQLRKEITALELKKSLLLENN
ncbi:DnaJ family domain-containing protein [Vibrio paucivorans]